VTSIFFRTGLGAVALSAALSPASAQSTPPANAAPAAKPVSGFEQAWKIPTLYKNDKADVLNELRIVGRLHLDNYVIDAKQGDDSDLVVRRARLGLRAKLFHKLDAQVQGDFNLEGGGPFYTRITDAYLAWKFSDAAVLTVGKQSAEFTLDGAISSTRLITIDRGNINQNFGVPAEYIPGIGLSGKAHGWTYRATVFSGGRDNGEFGQFDGGTVYVGSVGHDVAGPLGVKSAAIRLDYLHNKPKATNTFFRPFKDVAAMNLTVDDTRWGVSAELIKAQGAPGQRDGYGAMIMPWTMLAKKVQLVGRATHMQSDGVNGLRFSRYENVITARRGDRYQELYLGLNYLIFGQNLKLQSGLTYAHMRDKANDGGAYDGIAWTTGFRIGW
jgi:phosphate-selective porin OprO/OprP